MKLIVAPTPVADTATPASHFDDDAIASTHAEDYVVNGHAASPAEAQLLVPYSAAPPAGRSTASAFQQPAMGTAGKRPPVAVALKVGKGETYMEVINRSSS